MLRLVEQEERRFTALTDLRDALAAQDRTLIEVPIGQLSLTTAGRLQVGRFERRLTLSGWQGLLRTLEVPEKFATHVCPENLLVTIVNRLVHSQRRLVLVRVVDGLVTGVMPAKRQPIGHDLLVDWLGVRRPIEEAILAGEQLRITAVGTSFEEVMPNDVFGFGWDLVSGEDGWHTTELWWLVDRRVCHNKAVGLGGMPAFKRAYNSHVAAMTSLADLEFTIDNPMEPPELGPAIRWAAERRLGRETAAVVKYLAQRLEGDITESALGELTGDSSCFDLLNKITALGRFHRLDLRRRYEMEGGTLLNWFSRRGRTRPPWRRVSCAGCENWGPSRVIEEPAADQAEQDSQQTESH